MADRARPRSPPRRSRRSATTGGGHICSTSSGPEGTAKRFNEGTPAACFTETGQCLRGRSLEHRRANGDLARNGFPPTPERRELLKDGREDTVQYSARARQERHPENAGMPYEILLGQFRRRILDGYGADRAALPLPLARGFGKPRREREEVRRRLGYSWQEVETDWRLVVQPFTNGLALEIIKDSKPGGSTSGYDGNVFLFYKVGRSEVLSARYPDAR